MAILALREMEEAARAKGVQLLDDVQVRGWYTGFWRLCGDDIEKEGAQRDRGSQSQGRAAAW